MHEVGLHLQIEAIKKKGPEKDLFARSAYNRYYYSIFLLAREMLNIIIPEHGHFAHKAIPEILTGNIVKTLKRWKRTALKNQDYPLIKKIDSAIKAANDLSELMSRAYITRVVADYEPDEIINFSDTENFFLKGMSITEAQRWRGQATLWRDAIIDAWRQAHD